MARSVIPKVGGGPLRGRISLSGLVRAELSRWYASRALQSQTNYVVRLLLREHEFRPYIRKVGMFYEVTKVGSAQRYAREFIRRQEEGALPVRPVRRRVAKLPAGLEVRVEGLARDVSRRVAKPLYVLAEEFKRFVGLDRDVSKYLRDPERLELRLRELTDAYAAHASSPVDDRHVGYREMARVYALRAGWTRGDLPVAVLRGYLEDPEVRKRVVVTEGELLCIPLDAKGLGCVLEPRVRGTVASLLVANGSSLSVEESLAPVRLTSRRNIY